MKMKRNTASAVSGILMDTKINKVADGFAKKNLFRAFTLTRKVSKELAEDAEAIREKFRQDWADEFDIIRKLRDDRLPVVGHDDYLKAEAEANEALRELGENDVELDINTAPVECLQDPDLWGENDTLGQIGAKIDYLADNGILT